MAVRYGGRGGGNEGKGNEGIDSGRRNEISRSRGRNKSRIVSSMGYDRRRKRNTGTKRKSRYLGIDTTDVVPRDRCLSTDLFLSAAKIPIAASPIIGYFLASPSTKKLEKPTRLPFFRSSPLLFFLPFLLPSSANFSSADLSLPDALCLASSPIHFARVYSS